MIKLLAIAFISVSLFAACTAKNSETANEVSSAVHEDPEGYYTCPMHPEVHEHKPASCPICGMALVKVSGKKAGEKKEGDEAISFSGDQAKLAAVSKYTVVKKDIVVNIPLSGRLISSHEIAFQVYESDVSALKTGVLFKGAFSTNPNEKFSGKIVRVDNFLDPSTRTVNATGLLEKPARKIVTDSSFYGEAEIKLLNQIAVPEDAVFHAGERDLVYIFVDDSSVQPRPVVVGQKANHEYQILSGLNENEIISNGANFLIDSEAKIRGSSDKTHH